jgi:hypothetical protein
MQAIIIILWTDSWLVSSPSLRAEDDIHLWCTDDHICNRTQSRTLVFHVVDSIVANGHKVDVVVFVRFMNQVILDALEHGLSCLSFQDLNLVMTYVKLSANRCDGALNAIKLDRSFLYSNAHKMVIRAHHAQHLAKCAF